MYCTPPSLTNHATIISDKTSLCLNPSVRGEIATSAGAFPPSPKFSITYHF